MSKLSKLKQEAYLAGKKRNWDDAVAIYERILEIDRSNPTLINELGDICLRKGETAQAMSHFLSAAASYRNSGLQNNAVAVYKKVLRHEERNLTAHWYLAEIRAGQGLLAEGEEHGLQFLSASETIGHDSRDLFQKRCVQLMALYPASRRLLERLDQIFEQWSLPLERARLALLFACLDWDEGRVEEAERRVAATLEARPEVGHYAEHAAWRRRVAPQEEPAGYADVNTVDLDQGADAPAAPAGGGSRDLDLPAPGETGGGAEAPAAVAADAAEPEPAPSTVTVATAEAEPEPVAPDASGPGGDGPGDDPRRRDGAGGAAARVLPEEERDEEGCYEIDQEASIEGVMDDLAHLEGGADGAAAPAPEAEAERKGDGGEVDLLAEILAEGGEDLAAAADRQLTTIASEIGRQVGEGADPESQYEMGLVYLEMGMFDEATECFRGAAEDARFALRSLEMWGISLLRQQRHDEALEIFGRGLDAEAPEADKLALLYHAGRAHEEAGRSGEARDLYERAHAVSADFLDVARRLDRLA